MIKNQDFNTRFDSNASDFKLNIIEQEKFQMNISISQKDFDSDYCSVLVVEEGTDISEEAIEKAINKYLEEHPIEAATDYPKLNNKPSINGHELIGNKTAKDLGLQEAGNYLSSIPDEYVKQDALKDYVHKDDLDNLDVELPEWIGEEKPKYTATEVGADTAGTAENKIAEHNSSISAHADIRKIINDIDVPTKLSQLQNDVGYVTETIIPKEYVTETELNNYNFATKEEIPDVPVKSVNGQTGNVVLNAASVGALHKDTHIPTTIGELSNDAGFITKVVNDLSYYYLKTETYTQEEVNQLVSAIPKFAIQPVDELPVKDINSTTVYLLKTGEESENLYTEYIYVNDAWEMLGKQTVDLTGYALIKDIPTSLSSLQNDVGYITKAVNDLINYYGKEESYSKIEIDEKGFLTEHQDLTAYAKTSQIPTKTSQLQNNSGYITGTDVYNYYQQITSDLSKKANASDIPKTLSALTEDENHRTVTDIEKETWNNKLDASNLQDGINEALLQAKNSGEFKGEPGYTPIKYTDYFTSNEQSEMIEQTKNAVLSALQNANGVSF